MKSASASLWARDPIKSLECWYEARACQIAIGAVLGVGGAAVSTRYLTSLLHEVTPLDPLTFIVAPTIVTFAALAAVIIPAMRARSVDPTKLLRAQ